MYNHKFDRFGFASMPFPKIPETPFLDSSRQKTIENLRNFLNYRGFAVVSGQPGTGKTMLINHLCRQLNPNETKVMYIPFAVLKPSDMLKVVCQKLGLQPTVSLSKMLSAIQKCLTEIQPVNPVLVLDEIQKISHQTLEIIRLMSNVNFEENNMLSVIMLGNDEFIQQLRLRIYEPIRQRIGLFLHADPLSRTNTIKYIEHQFQQAGAHQAIIDEQTANMVYDLSSGIPRIINSIMIAALEVAADNSQQNINIDHINAVRHMVLLPTSQELPS